LRARTFAVLSVCALVASCKHNPRCKLHRDHGDTAFVSGVPTAAVRLDLTIEDTGGVPGCTAFVIERRTMFPLCGNAVRWSASHANPGRGSCSSSIR
jgi:hypothetical protein